MSQLDDQYAENRDALITAMQERLSQEARNARTINQRTVVMGTGLYVIVKPHPTDNGWMLMENMAGRRIWSQAANSTLWLAEDSDMPISSLSIS